MILRNFLWVLFFLIQFPLSAQEIKIQKGTVVDSVAVSDTVAESFSLYIPQAFENDKPWPVILVFDSEGRGTAAAQYFRGIAEEQGFLIAATNEKFQEDSLTSSVSIAANMVNRVYQMLPLDGNMIYTAGLDEGARVASALPVVYQEIDGVLAIGDAWVNPDLIEKNNKYFFSAVAGDKDVKRFDLQRIAAVLNEAGYPTEMNLFEGHPGEWPGEAVLANAVAGFTLEAIAKGHKEPEEGLVRQLFEKELEYTETLRRKREYLMAYEKLEQMESKYGRFNFEDEIKEKQKALRRNRAFRQQRRQYRRVAAKEVEMQTDYLYYLDSDIATANFDNLGWWSFQMEELEKMQESDNPAEEKAGYRLEGFLDQYSEQRYDEIQQIEEPVNIDVEIFVSILRTIFDEEDPEPYLNIIKRAGRDGDYYTALLYLEDLLKTGYDDMESLYDIEGILDLKLSPEYNELIEEYLGEAKYYRAD